MHIVFVHRGKHKNGEKKGHKDVVYYPKHNDITLFTWQYKKTERRKRRRRKEKKKGGGGGGGLCTMQNTSDIQLLIWQCKKEIKKGIICKTPMVLNF